MMRLFLIVLFELVLVVAVSAQGLPIEPVVTNKLPEGSITLPTGPQSSSAQPVHILTDDSRRSETEEKAESINAGRNTKASFLLSTGIEYADEGEFEEAERAYLRALEVHPDDEQTLMRLGSLYVQMDRFKDAVAMFQKQLELEPENPLAHNNLAWCYAIGPEVRSVSLALRHSREALLFAPTMPSVWNTLAEAYYVSGDYDKALRSAEQALLLLERIEGDHEESLRSFQEQLSKIKLAKEASDMLKGFKRDQ
ncbi:tetratricopeptide repeat protein [Tichowtungia aerotolerans]|uniref:Tetratricopeptide repeat protein n=1 Tax=Tichowtungia aerotolerans TaxID=2697043 RepID=A0A6P1M968_9BACT|nr:tetratricopeptide repeat protein [Tichowtungia aerotolerans]QHI68628.1 tetratricopeptide repeat protein [Tichowtungia aerotolerans]